MIRLPHTHLDHAGALPMLRASWDVPTYMPAEDRPLFETLPRKGPLFGMPHLDRPCDRIDPEVYDGHQVIPGETQLRFLSTPGHTPGQDCWYDDEDILVGDTLFAGSIGRTDLPLSDPQKMVANLRKLTSLPGHLRVHSGHGPMTPLKEELHTNPFLGYIRKERGNLCPSGLHRSPGTMNRALGA